jgi:hypothetical protein
MIRLHNALKSSRAAIDLASIMVGIIIIGLIGGVIAATVFAVIPWSQDKAAKQQLESIHTSENALYGLSSDSNVDLKGGATQASFGNSAILDANNLLTLSSNGAYCVINTPDGKDYHAYAKSGSGKWFIATNNKKTAQVVASNVVPCIISGATAGTVDPVVDDGSKDLTAGNGSGSGNSGTVPAPPAPVYTNVFKYDMENYAAGDTIRSPWYYYNSATNEVRLDTTYSHGGRRGLFVTKNTTGSSTGIGLSQTGLTPGATYRVTGWVMTEVASNVELSTSTVTTGKVVSKSGTWQQLSLEVTADSRGSVSPTFYAYTTYIHLDDVAVDKIS